jgi:hypothetical protein
MEDTHTDTNTEGRDLTKYSFEVGSGAIICIKSSVKIGSGIQKLTGGDLWSHRQHSDVISLLLVAILSLATCRMLVSYSADFYPEHGGDKFLRNVGSHTYYRRCVPEDGSMSNFRRENLKSYKAYFYFST